MKYLMIRNPGVADHRGLTLLGVSTTRFSNLPGTVGTFGSGAKLSIALLLRNNIDPVVICGNLKLEFFTKPELVKGQLFHRVCVKYSGKDLNGNTKNSTEDLGFTLEWGAQDWTKPSMAFREFVSNAIDSSICSGGSYNNVEFEITEKPRAKNGCTTVFLPVSDMVKDMISGLERSFLHFSHPELLQSRCLPKRDPEKDKVLVYKKGVLVCYITGKSVFDYNLGDELTLDESRNASEWDVKYSIAKALRSEDDNNLATIIKAIINEPDTWEGKLDSYNLKDDSYDPTEDRAKRKIAFQNAWNKVAGPKGVITSGNIALSSFILDKGFTPVHVCDGWAKALESYGILSEKQILTRNELDGKIVSEGTPEMIECTKKVWKLFEDFNLTNGKSIPGVKGFTSIMDGSSQTLGYYIPGGNDIFLHTSLGVGKMMSKVCLEELVHYATGCEDGSRAIQDLLFNLVTDIAF